ncbi:MAG: lipase family protein [Proteobacteria bacterium]|nr:lipase family protein [Pseudomonadota bacterium]
METRKWFQLNFQRAKNLGPFLLVLMALVMMTHGLLMAQDVDSALVTSDVSILADAPKRCAFSQNSRAYITEEKPDQLSGSVFQSGNDQARRVPFNIVYTGALASKIAYYPRDHVTQILNRAGYGVVEHLEEDSIRGFFAFNAKLNCAIVSFRGSNDVEDWYTNSLVSMKRVPDGYIHTGFYNAFSAIESRIFFHFRNYVNSKTSIILTGHSMGGSMSGVLAYKILKFNSTIPTLSERKINVEWLLTYGQPKFGDFYLIDFLSKSFGHKYLRSVNESDFVSKVPLTGYSHGGNLVWFSKSQFHYDTYSSPTLKLIVDDVASADQGLDQSHNSHSSDTEFESIEIAPLAPIVHSTNQGRFFGGLGMNWFSDHKMIRYINTAYAAMLEQK